MTSAATTSARRLSSRLTPGPWWWLGLVTIMLRAIRTPRPMALMASARDPALVVAVAGVTLANKKHPRSNYGNWVDLCAPYGPYVSTWGSQSFATVIGTSYSTVLVSGLLGVLMANYGWPR